MCGWQTAQTHAEQYRAGVAVDEAGGAGPMAFPDHQILVNGGQPTLRKRSHQHHASNHRQQPGKGQPENHRRNPAATMTQRQHAHQDHGQRTGGVTPARVGDHQCIRRSGQQAGASDPAPQRCRRPQPVRHKRHGANEVGLHVGAAGVHG